MEYSGYSGRRYESEFCARNYFIQLNFIIFLAVSAQRAEKKEIGMRPGDSVAHRRKREACPALRMQIQLHRVRICFAQHGKKVNSMCLSALYINPYSSKKFDDSAFFISFYQQNCLLELVMVI